VQTQGGAKVLGRRREPRPTRENMDAIQKLPLDGRDQRWFLAKWFIASIAKNLDIPLARRSVGAKLRALHYETYPFNKLSEIRILGKLQPVRAD
jgi:hypothetical protein